MIIKRYFDKTMEKIELIEKKSRFIVFVGVVNSEDEAKAFIAEKSKEYKKASHIVYAYVLPNIEKFNDDGEPRGTAGLPLLNAIKGRKLSGAVVVVARYFGGILLGKGGLMRAYGKAAGKSLDAFVT